MCESYWVGNATIGKLRWTPSTIFYRNELRLWLNLSLPSVKLVKKVRVGSKVRRVYDAAQTPLERVLAGGQFKQDQGAELKKLHLSLDPFQLGKVIDQKLERIYQRANRRLSRKRRRKARRLPRKRHNAAGETAVEKPLPQPRRPRVFGYISNVSRDGPGVTFSCILKWLDAVL
jgi:hypothetical protein